MKRLTLFRYLQSMSQNKGPMTDSQVFQGQMNQMPNRVDILATQMGKFVGNNTIADNAWAFLFRLIGRMGLLGFSFFINGPVRYLILSSFFFMAFYAPMLYICGVLFNSQLPFIYDPVLIGTGFNYITNGWNIPPEALPIVQILLSPVSYLYAFYTSLSELQYQPLSVGILILSTFPLTVALELFSVNLFVFIMGTLNFTVLAHCLFLWTPMRDFYNGDLSAHYYVVLLSFIFFNMSCFNYYFQPLFKAQRMLSKTQFGRKLGLTTMNQLGLNVLGEPHSDSTIDNITGNNLFKSPIRWR